MKRIFLFFAICFCVSSWFGILEAQTLRAILFVNEQEPEREKDRREDMKQMDAFWQEIAGAIGYDYQCSRHSGHDFTAEGIRNSISALNVGANDIVVFYYSGHGYNDETNVWPTLTLNDAGIQEIEILKRLKKVNAKAKLTLCIADCCNKPFRSRNTSSVAYSYETDESAVKKLFTSFKGKKTIIISASKQGQYSWSDQEQGAIFGMSFRQAVRNVAYEEATWDMVMEKAKAQTMRRAPELQIPQYNVTQSSDPFE